MQFSWNDDKRQKNIEKHGIDFVDAAQIFDGFRISRIDNRFDYGETREISIGMMNDIMVIVVVHTDRDGTQHLISARPASRKERKIYHDAKALRETDYE